MLNRREFIHSAGGGAAALVGSSFFTPARVLGANDRVRFALIGEHLFHATGEAQFVEDANQVIPNGVFSQS